MKTQSRVIIHAGINFLTVPSPVVMPQTSLALQQAVLDQGLEFSRVETPKNTIAILRDAPYNLQVVVSMLEQQMGQLLVMASQPKGSLQLFIHEAEAAIQAYETVWPSPNRQIIQADATIRELYETTSQHAFQELWEKRLGQPSQSLSAFGRPIRGGGLRFVMDPVQETFPVQIEVKIESFLQDTTKIFVETLFTWPIPAKPQSLFDVRERLESINTYIETHVQPFILGDNHDIK